MSSYRDDEVDIHKSTAPSKRVKTGTNMSLISPIPYNGNSTVADTTDMHM
jgi:hypothetical protein